MTYRYGLERLRSYRRANATRPFQIVGHVSSAVGLDAAAIRSSRPSSVARYRSQPRHVSTSVAYTPRPPVSARTPRLPKELGCKAVITSKTEPFENAGKIIIADPNWMFTETVPLTRAEIESSADSDVCRVMLTSGTTGEAKAIRFTHGSVQGKSARNEYAKGSRVAVTSRMFCDLGITTGPAFRYLIFMLSRGGTIDAMQMYRNFSGRDAKVEPLLERRGLTAK